MGFRMRSLIIYFLCTITFSKSVLASNCVVSEWEPWGLCTAPCGNNGFSCRDRIKIIAESNGGICPESLRDCKVCNRFCFNRGIPTGNQCKCNPGTSGYCCQIGGGTVTYPPDYIPYLSTTEQAPVTTFKGELIISCSIL